MKFCYSEYAPNQEPEMVKPTPNQLEQQSQHEARADKPQSQERQDWETPRMEDVSEQVMAQPYIRFT